MTLFSRRVESPSPSVQLLSCLFYADMSAILGAVSCQSSSELLQPGGNNTNPPQLLTSSVPLLNVTSHPPSCGVYSRSPKRPPSRTYPYTDVTAPVLPSRGSPLGLLLQPCSLCLHRILSTELSEVYSLLLSSKLDAAARAHLLRFASLIGRVRRLEQDLGSLQETQTRHIRLCAALTDATETCQSSGSRVTITRSTDV